MTAQTRTALSGASVKSDAPARIKRNKKRGSGLRVFASLFFALGIGIALSVVYITNRWTRVIPNEVLLLIIPLSVGLGAGIGTRVLLRGRRMLFQLTVGLAGVCLTVLFLGWLSAGTVGSLILPWDGKEPQLDGLLQIFLGFLGVLLVLPAWRGRKSKGSEQQAQPIKTDVATAVVSAPSPDTRQIGLKIVLPEARPIRRAQRPAARPPAKKSKPKKKRKKNKNNDISFAGEAVDRCPYCLETVDTSNPADITVCEICKTPHHSDCWAVTGSCQVAHYQE